MGLSTSHVTQSELALRTHSLYNAPCARAWHARAWTMGPAAIDDEEKSCAAAGYRQATTDVARKISTHCGNDIHMPDKVVGATHINTTPFYSMGVNSEYRFIPRDIKPGLQHTITLQCTLCALDKSEPEAHI